MGVLRKYREYLSDNPRGLWFKRKLYGYGWTPAKWQGWLVIALYILTILKIFWWADYTSHSGSDTLMRVAVPFIIATLLLIVICRWKGEKPSWQWGKHLED